MIYSLCRLARCLFTNVNGSSGMNLQKIVEMFISRKMLARVNCKNEVIYNQRSKTMANIYFLEALYFLATTVIFAYFPSFVQARKRKVITPIAEITSRQKFSIVPSIVMQIKSISSFKRIPESNFQNQDCCSIETIYLVYQVDKCTVYTHTEYAFKKSLFLEIFF